MSMPYNYPPDLPHGCHSSRHALEAIAACRHPTVAMIYGPCAGGGLEIACQCDLRIASESARLDVPINRLRIAIAYDELSALLPLVGRAVALGILVEGRRWTAREALAKGLLTRVVPDGLRCIHEQTHAQIRRALVKGITQRTRRDTRDAKETIRRPRGARTHPVAL